MSDRAPVPFGISSGGCYCLAGFDSEATSKAEWLGTTWSAQTSEWHTVCYPCHLDPRLLARRRSTKKKKKKKKRKRKKEEGGSMGK
jgi:hypothetical protein